MNLEVARVDDLAYDVGLHKGEDAAFYLAMGYRVVGFEADPDLAEACRRRFAAEIDAARMTIVEGAITHSPHPFVAFYRHPISVWGTISEELVERNLVVAKSERIEVPTVSFSNTLRDTGMPAFMKVDIEGADLHCLHALKEFRNRPRWLSVESNQVEWEKLEAEFTLLEELGYDRFAVVQQATIPGTEVVTRTLAGEPLIFRFEEDASGAFGDDVGPWMDRDAALARYRRIFRAYSLLGAGSLLRRTKLGRAVPGLAARHLHLALPGWFDTHAAHRAG